MAVTGSPQRRARALLFIVQYSVQQTRRTATAQSPATRYRYQCRTSILARSWGDSGPIYNPCIYISGVILSHENRFSFYFHKICTTKLLRNGTELSSSCHFNCPNPISGSGVSRVSVSANAATQSSRFESHHPAVASRLRFGVPPTLAWDRPIATTTRRDDTAGQSRGRQSQASQSEATVSICQRSKGGCALV